MYVGEPRAHASGTDFIESYDFFESQHKLLLEGDEFSALLWLYNPGWEMGATDHNILALDVSFSCSFCKNSAHTLRLFTDAQHKQSYAATCAADPASAPSTTLDSPNLAAALFQWQLVYVSAGSDFLELGAFYNARHVFARSEAVRCNLKNQSMHLVLSK